MSDAITSSSDQWIQYHYQYQNFDESAAIPHSHGGLSDSISVSSSFIGGGGDTTNNMLAPENSSAVGNDLSPRGNIGKPVRRRSRTSRRTPTTLLNASIKNFRTLVQQYTGCQTVVASSSVINQKGPINLSFGSSREPNNITNTNSFDGRYYNGHPHFQVQNQHYQHQNYLQINQEQQQQGLLQPDENHMGDYSAFSSSGQNTMTVDNFEWQ